jgi:hypothetical protein
VAKPEAFGSPDNSFPFKFWGEAQPAARGSRAVALPVLRSRKNENKIGYHIIIKNFHINK